MDYINYVKQYPMMGMIGYGGGAASLGRFSAGGEPVPNGSTFFGDRALITGGYTPTTVNEIEVKNITNNSDSTDFGDLLEARRGGMGASDGVRGITAGGRSPDGSATDMIQYKVIPFGAGDASVDFGNLTPEGRNNGASSSDGTRAIFLGGGGPNDYTGHSNGQIITTQTLGNATVCGSLPANRIGCCGASNGTRGIVAGGSSNAQRNQIAADIYYFTMASFGSGSTASSFGNLTPAMAHGGGTDFAGAAANTTRMIYMMGRTRYNAPPNYENAISQQCVYITVATTSNATDFGDNQDQPTSDLSGFGNATRGGFGGGYGTGFRNSLKYFTYDTLSNSTGFGDLGGGDRAGTASMSGAAS